MSCSSAMLTSTSASTVYLEALLRHMYCSLTAFHFHSFTHKFLRSTLFELDIPFLCSTQSSALGHHVTTLPLQSPLVSTQCLQHSPKAVQNITTQLVYEHVNDSFFILLYPGWARCVERIMDIVRHCAES
jgi:hypothetical protein